MVSFMARPLRIVYPGAVYHVMNRGLARQRIFRSQQDYEAFLHIVGDAYALWRIEVFGYCLMGDHYHLCLRTPVANLARVMRHINGLYTQRFNRTYRRDGPLFRGRYKAILVQTDSYLSAVIRYIHLNPVEAKLVRWPEDYRWSSHAAYLRNQSAVPWLQTQDMLTEFGSRRAFHKFVLSGNDEELEEFYSASRQQPVLGSEKFRSKLARKTIKVSREHPRHERMLVCPSVAQVVKAVGHVYGVKPSAILVGRRGHESESRKVAMHLVKRLCDLTLQETAKEFGVTSYGTIGWASAQVKMRQAKDKGFERQINRVFKRLKPRFL